LPSSVPLMVDYFPNVLILSHRWHFNVCV
jgi:hypothetical protein